jgi:hypothetical protein
MTKINEMTNELLVIVFCYLDFESKLNVKIVCKLWHQLICYSFNSNQYLLIKDINHNIYQRLGQFTPFGLKKFSKNLSVISLKQMKSFLDKKHFYKTFLFRIVSNDKH